MHDKSDSTSVSAAAGSGILSGFFAPLFCIISMTSIQLGGALSSPVLKEYGTVSTTWLRLCVAALVLLLIVRPSFRSWTVRQWYSAVILGGAMAGMTLCYFEALQHVPLGLTVAINFMGPLGVTIATSRNPRMLVWVVLAVLGIGLLSRHSGGWVVSDMKVLLYPAGAAICWAVYIILMKYTGTQSGGMGGLAASVTLAALLITPFGLFQSGGHLYSEQFFDAAWLAFLVPLIPYILELKALRIMTAPSFGIMMSAEPAIAAVAGYIFLAQTLSGLQIAGIICVVVASAGSIMHKH